jgi:hypothetical protein
MENLTEEQKAIFEKEISLARDQIQLILKKYNVALLPVITHIGNNTTSSVDIVKLKEQPKEPEGETKSVSTKDLEE